MDKDWSNPSQTVIHLVSLGLHVSVSLLSECAKITESCYPLMPLWWKVEGLSVFTSDNYYLSKNLQFSVIKFSNDSGPYWMEQVTSRLAKCFKLLIGKSKL